MPSNLAVSDYRIPLNDWMSYPIDSIFQGSGEMRALCRALDWTTTSLGPLTQWPPSLRTAVQLVLASPFPNIILWGKELTQIYNDGYRELMGNKHPVGLGQPTQTCWPEVWHINQPLYDRVWAGESFSFNDALYPITRSGQLQDAWFTLAYSPVRDESGQVSGVLVTVFETTHQVFEQRYRQQALTQQQHKDFLLQLTDALRPMQDAQQIATTAMRGMAQMLDVLRAGYYEVEADQDTFTLTASWERPDATRLSAKMLFTEFGHEVREGYRAGRTLVVRDTELEMTDEANKAAHRAIGVRAWIGVPLIKHGRMVVGLGVHSKTPRNWTAAEVSLVEEIAERTWVAVERARSEASLRQSEAEFRTVTEAAPGLVWVCSAGGENIYFNQRWYDYTGQTAQDASGYGWTTTMHPDDAARILPYWQACQRTGDPYEGEVRYRRHDGVYRWHTFRAMPRRSPTGQIDAWYGLSIDTDDTRQAQTALYQSEARQRAIFESAKDYAIFTADLDRRITSWSRGAQAVFGYEPTHILHQSADRLFTPEDRQQNVPQQEAQKAIGQGQAENERWHCRADGTRFYGSGVVTPLRDEAGSIVGVLKVVRDLTVQKQAEQALQEADQRKDEFLAMLAHELRNPLAPVRNGLQLLAQTHQADPLLDSLLPIMNRQMDHLMRMVDDLLDVSRISRGKIELRSERLDLTQLVAQTVEAMRPIFSSAGRQLQAQLPDHPLYLAGDATRLNQVVTNLLTNGLRYTGEEGQVWLDLAAVGPQAALRVRDNGIGLAADQLETIFGLFVQVDTSLARSFGGLGLGLALVQELVQRHGGRVEAHSEGLGQGSEFVVYLPLFPA